MYLFLIFIDMSEDAVAGVSDKTKLVSLFHGYRSCDIWKVGNNPRIKMETAPLLLYNVQLESIQYVLSAWIAASCWTYIHHRLYTTHIVNVTLKQFSACISYFLHVLLHVSKLIQTSSRMKLFGNVTVMNEEKILIFTRKSMKSLRWLKK